MAEEKRSDVAQVAWEMAKSLWMQEKGKNPKVSDAQFMALVALCTKSLQGVYDPDDARHWAEAILK